MQILEEAKKVLSSKMKGDKWCVQATPVLVEIAKETKDILARKELEAQPINEALQIVTNNYKGALDTLAKMDEVVRERVLKEHEGHESVLVEGVGELVFAAGSWEIEVVDLKKVDPKYLTVDKKAVEKDAKMGIQSFKGMSVNRGRSLRVMTKVGE